MEDKHTGSGTKERYGVAFDIGTSTVVGMLWNLKKSELVAVEAMANPQGIYGSDVISRIAYGGQSEANLKELQLKIVTAINEIINIFNKKYNISREKIHEITAVGNTAMSHFLIGVDASPLAQAPFKASFSGAIFHKAKNLNIKVNDNGDFYMLPNIAGHVGSDVLAGILATDIVNSGKITVQVDIGTNGEIILWGKGRLLTCSAAAGPAFEGASIFQGMRAIQGAIERVLIKDNEVEVKVIGDVTPQGICGSGIIDGVAQLINRGIIDNTGRFLEPQVLLDKGVSLQLIGHLRSGAKGKEFVLFQVEDGEDIVILQKDVREVQMAKAAIYMGIKLLMKGADIRDDEIQKINVAGVFGSYISVESALAIGLLPAISKEKIVSVGNAAGEGASMALLSMEMRKKAEQLVKSIVHVELALLPDFQKDYLTALNF